MHDQSSALLRNELSEGTETRECRSCLGTGWMLLDSTYDPTSGELVQEMAACFICRSAGEVSTHLYETQWERRA